MQPAQITANSVSSISSPPSSLADIEVRLRGLTLLRDSFEKLTIQAIPNQVGGQIKEHYRALAESANQLLKGMDSVLRRLYDSYVMALKHPSDEHLRSALHELLSQQHQKLVRKISSSQQKRISCLTRVSYKWYRVGLDFVGNYLRF